MNWAVFVLAVVLGLLLVLAMVVMMGPGMMGPGFMGATMMLLGWLLGLALLAVLVLAAAWLFRQLTTGSLGSASGAFCANCGLPLQAEWRHCPRCGQVLPQRAGGQQGAP